MLNQADIIIERYHPELLRQLAGAPGPAARARTAITWNVFRTLALITPAFWLRRVRARLGLDPLQPAPTGLEVHLWPPLPRFAPHISQGVVDVTVETDTAVLGIVALHREDIACDPSGPDRLLQAIEATAWFAGRRECLVGVVTTDPHDSAVAAGLVRRYAKSPDGLRKRLANTMAGEVGGVGLTTWSDLLAVLGDCAETPVLTPLERAAATAAAEWLQQSGAIDPRTARTPSSFATA